MKRICAEVEEATEEVIVKTRAESEAKINQLESEIYELQQKLKEAKRSAKYDLDDLARANRSLRLELEEANDEMSRMHSELEAKTDEYDALNEDVERFAETFAAQVSRPLTLNQSSISILHIFPLSLIIYSFTSTKKTGNLSAKLDA